MPRIYTDEELRALMGELGGEVGAPADGRPAVRRAKRRLGRNFVASALVIAAFGYGTVSVADRLRDREEQPVQPSPDRMTTGLWTMDADGSNAAQITDGIDDDQPAWSPAGERIAFIRTVDGNDELFVVDADGSDPVRLTDTAADESDPAWTADGRRIAFVRGDPDRPVIFSVAADGSDERRIVDGRSPAFSFGGKWLTYACPARGEGTLCQTDPTGETEPVEVDTGGRPAESPVWVNDTAIVFRQIRPETGLFVKNYSTNQFERLPSPADEASGVGPGPFEGVVASFAGDLFVSPPGGPKIERITFDPTVHDSDPTWNPVAKRIAVRRVVEPGTAIFVADADGSNVRRLTEGTRVDGGAVMSPDGTTIAFASSRDGYAAIYLMNADGSNERRVTHETAGTVRPLWSPDGRLLYVVRSHPMNPLERGISVVPATGGIPTEIVSPKESLSAPSLSRDGTRLAYTYGDPDGPRSLYVAAVDGSGERAVVGGFMDHPAWGPGERLVYLEGPSTSRRLAFVNADGSGQRPGAAGWSSAQGVSWGAGSEVLLANNGDIVAVDPESDRRRTVLALPGNQYNPSWTPDGRILFNGDVG